MAPSDPRLLLLSPADNVLVLRAPVRPGEAILVENTVCVMGTPVPLGHKLARYPIGKGDRIVKYGAAIGSATADIPVGAHVHVHNVRSDYTASQTLDAARAASGEDS